MKKAKMGLGLLFAMLFAFLFVGTVNAETRTDEIVKELQEEFDGLKVDGIYGTAKYENDNRRFQLYAI